MLSTILIHVAALPVIWFVVGMYLVLGRLAWGYCTGRNILANCHSCKLYTWSLHGPFALQRINKDVA